MTSANLTILYVDTVSVGLSTNQEMLNEYLDSRNRSDIQINIHRSIDNIWIRSQDFVTIIPSNVRGKDAIIRYALDQGVDIVFDPYDTFDHGERLAHSTRYSL